jgi:hypothetical protein
MVIVRHCAGNARPAEKFPNPTKSYNIKTNQVLKHEQGRPKQPRLDFCD